jgi:hypothetical protein
MWPSLPVANHIADIANWFFIGSLVVGVVSTVLIVWMAGVKEGYWEQDRRESGERIAELATQGDQLRKDTAEANARAAEAQLALEKFRNPRVLSERQRAEIISKMHAWTTIPKSGLPQSAAVFSTDSSFEAANLANELASALGPGGAKWTINRYPVMYGMSFTVSGVGILTSSSPRGIAVAENLSATLNSVGVSAFVISEKRKGCEDIESLKSVVDTDPACSSISVIVGEHPR